MAANPTPSTPPPPEFVQIAMVVLALAPVAGAVASGPIVGGTLMSLALFDTVMLLFGLPLR